MVRNLPGRLFSLLGTAILFSCSTAAFADTISLSLASGKQAGVPGSTVSFLATISAPTANSGSYFLSDNASFNPSPASTLTINDDPFLNNFFSASFNPGTSLTALLFTVALPSNLASGGYTGFFEVFDGADYLSSNVRSAATFEIDVPAAASPVPEPGTWILLATGLLATVSCALHRKHNQQNGVGCP